MKLSEFFAWVGLVAMGLGLATIVGGAVIGYVLNLIGIAHWHEGIGVLVLRVIGAVIAPLGACLGWLL